jgi:hypothetical protein
VTFTSIVDKNELYPQHEDNTLQYSDLHQELESWTAFRALPELMKFDAKMDEHLENVESGYLPVPEYTKIVNPPSLWAYYLTLPQWARDHSVVRNILYAFEYHQPRMNIKDKEVAMNLACSYLQPIEGRMLDVVRDMVASQKIRMDGQLGKEMVSELQFYQLDPHWLGTETEDFDDDGAEEAEI